MGGGPVALMGTSEYLFEAGAGVETEGTGRKGESYGGGMMAETATTVM